MNTNLRTSGPRVRTKPQRLSCERLEDRHLLAVSFLPGDDVVGPAFQNQTDVAIAAGGSGYLAVWTDERAVISGSTNQPENPISGNMQDVYGQLLDQAGQPVGSQIIVANMGRNQRRPDVAWNDTAQAWLVVFESQDPDWYFDENVMSVRVAADGTVLDSQPTLLFGAGSSQANNAPAVASDGDQWVAITDQFISTTVATIGRRIAADGTLTDSQPVVLQHADLQFSDIAYANGVYLIAGKHRLNGQILAQRVDPNLDSLGSLVAVGPSHYRGPAVASDGTDFMVVGVRAHRVTSSGQVLDPAGIPLGGSTGPNDFQDVAWTGDEWAVAMLNDELQQSSQIQRISSQGVLVDAEPILVEAGIDGLLEPVALAGSGTGEAMITYPQRSGPDVDMRAALFRNDGTVATPNDLAFGLPRQVFVEVVDGPGNENLAVFLSQRSGESRLLSQRVTDDGIVLDAEPLMVSDQFGIPQVAWNGSVYLVTWDDPATGNIVGKRLSATNNLIDAQPIVILDDVVIPDHYYNGAVTAVGDTFVAGMIKEIRFHEPVRYPEFVRVRGSDGAVLDPLPRTFGVGGYVGQMTAATVGDNAIIAWAQFSIHDDPHAIIQAGLVNASGQVITVTSGLSQSLGSDPDIAVNGNQALVVWDDPISVQRDDIRGRFVMSDGTMPEGEFLISDAVGDQMFPAVGWTGDQYVVAWNDYRHVQSGSDIVQQHRADIRGARVTTDGTLLDLNGFTVTQTAVPEDLPTVAGGGGNSLILFSMLDGVSGQPEIQRIAYQVGPVIEFNLQPFESAQPLGSLVSRSTDNSGFLAAAFEEHVYNFFADNGDNIAAVVTPVDPTVTLSGRFEGLGATATATGPGEPLIVPAAGVSSAGTVTLTVFGDGSSIYDLQVYRNVNVDLLDDSASLAVIDDSFVELGSGRYAAIGQSTATVGAPQFVQYNDPGKFIDISATGIDLFLGSDQERTIFTTVGNSLLSAGLTLVGNDGAIMDDHNESIPPNNIQLPYSFWPGTGAALAVFWDQLDSNVLTGGVFWEEQIVNGINTLIVQWEKLPAHNSSSNGDVTFQAQIFETGPVLARYVYKDVDFGDPVYDGGASATIGIQFDQTTADVFSHNSPVLTDGDVVDYVAQTYTVDVDDLTVDLEAGSRIDVVLQGIDDSFDAQTLELLDASENLLATASTTWAGSPITNFDLGILDYQVPSTGTYTVRVGSDLLAARYSVVVTEDLVYDTEPNDAPGSLRQLDGNHGALGFLDGEVLVNHTQYSDPSLFVDISASGTPLNLTKDGEATVITNVGNAAFPAGFITIGNNGAVPSGSNRFVPFGNDTLPTLYFDAALVPFWDDFGDTAGNVYYEERVVNGINTLIVQWDDRPHFDSTGTATFQAQLFDSGPIAARYAYQDVDFGNPAYDGGASATVGMELGTTNFDQVSYNTPFLANGDVIDFFLIQGDRYDVDLVAGQTLTVQTATPRDAEGHDSPNLLDPAVMLLDSSGTMVLAMDSNSAPDGKNALLTYTVPTSGTYVLTVFEEAGTGEYVLTVSSSALIDGDFDGDGDYDTDDIDALTTAIVNGGPVDQFDLSGDGMLAMDDVDLWRLAAGEANLGPGRAYLPGDANLDGAVDGSDFIAWNTHKFTADTYWSHGDFNADGAVDGLDFIIWNANKFQSSDGARQIVWPKPPGDWHEMDDQRRIHANNTIVSASSVAPQLARMTADRVDTLFATSRRRERSDHDTFDDLTDDLCMDSGLVSTMGRDPTAPYTVTER